MVSDELAHDGAAVGDSVSIDGAAHVAEPPPGVALGNGPLEAGARGLEQR
jgi:hypothetical protein